MIIVNDTAKTITALRDANALLRKHSAIWSELPPNMSEDQLIDALLTYADKSPHEYRLLSYQHHFGVCGCVGPQNGDPLCPCVMSGWLESYRFDVALEYLKRKGTK